MSYKPKQHAEEMAKEHGLVMSANGRLWSRDCGHSWKPKRRADGKLLKGWFLCPKCRGKSERDNSRGEIF
jgi:hypothetical protein